MTSKTEFHPYADLFPMMSAAELEALADDIADNGLRTAIVRYQGAILDGRNRLKACEAKGIEPRFEDFEGTDEEAHALVISLNVQRRNLTTGQRASVAAKDWGLENKTDGRRSKNVTNGIVSAETLVKQFHISKRDLTQARDLLRDAQDLAREVEQGSPLSTKYNMFLERQRELAD